MRRTIIYSVAALVAVTVLLAAGLTALRPGQPERAGEPAAAGGASTSEEPVAPRPACPAGGVGGVELDCLGGSAGQGESAGVTVVNLWAWWCDPCRAELPVIEQFAREHPEYTVVGVHADRAAGRGAALLEDLGVGLPSYQDSDNRFAGTLGLPGVVPLTVVFRDGEKVATFPKVFSSSAELADAVAGAV